MQVTLASVEGPGASSWVGVTPHSRDCQGTVRARCGPHGEGASMAAARGLTSGAVYRARDPSSQELVVNPRDGGESQE